MSKRQRNARLPEEPVRVSIESLSPEGRGVARVEGKTVFVDGALPGEEVSFRYTRQARRHDEGRVCEVHEASPHRVEPGCEAFGICGGCCLQHLAPEQQLLAKQRSLLDNLERIGGVQPERLLDPIAGPVWGYRSKARLGVKFVRKKGRVLVGFREKRSPYLADIARCEVLHPSLGTRLAELAELIQAMEARERIAQIEVAVGESAAALVFRNLDPLSPADRQRLVAYGAQTGLHLYLQPAGPDSIELLWPEPSELYYRLPDHDLTLHFRPTDFTQVNPGINPPMVRQALELLDLKTKHQVLDLFCGLGNFTLPIARRVARVVGVEGEAGLVQRARDNAAANGLKNVAYHAVDLSADPLEQPWMQQRYDRILLDPPRSGALEILLHLGKTGAQRIVYVSCHPGSLARDAGILVHELGYRLAAAGVMDMFPHTAHVESMALFAKQDG